MIAKTTFIPYEINRTELNFNCKKLPCDMFFCFCRCRNRYAYTYNFMLVHLIK